MNGILKKPPRGPGLWIAGVRPQTLTIAASPVIAGTGLAFHALGTINWPVMIVTLTSALLVQAGTNLYNDAADGLSGQDSAARIGPDRLTALGWASPDEVKRMAIFCFGLATLGGIFLALTGGWPIIAIGLLSITCGYAYSSGPWPISHTPLGELFVIAFFGIIAVAGTYYLQVLTINMKAIFAGIAIGCFGAAVLMVNNMRDLEQDRAGGRRTLAIVAKEKLSRWIYSFLVLAPFVIQLVIELGPGGAGNWLPILPLPFGLFLIWKLPQANTGFAFNSLLVQTAKLQFAFSMLFFLGLLTLKLEHVA